MSRVVIADPAASMRLSAARAFVRRQVADGRDALVVGVSRSAADELVAGVAAEQGGLVGVSRAGVGELALRLAMPSLVARGLRPTPALGAEALAARAAFECRGELHYFAPVSDMPGFARSLARTLSELRLAGVRPDAIGGDPALEDLARLLARTSAEEARGGVVHQAELLEVAAEAAPHEIGSLGLLLLDVPLHSMVDGRFLRALVGGAADALVTVPSGDVRTLRAWQEAGLDAAPAGNGHAAAATALERLQQHLFADAMPPVGVTDESVHLFSAPGEGREAVEIARRVLAEASRGVPFDEMAILVRAPQTYLSLFEHALERAGVPAWFHRGTRRPDPAGRALLALLACAEEGLSARRFAEYVSLGQVPAAAAAGAPPDEPWQPALDDVVEAVVPDRDRVDEMQPEEEQQEQSRRPATEDQVAGTLRAPWRWEDLIVEAAVIGGIDRWRRRLAGLENDYRTRLRALDSEDAQSSRARAVRRDVDQLRALQTFALPVLAELAEWPDRQTWGEWLAALNALAPAVLARPARVLRVLQEIAPLSAIGPVTLREVRDVLAPRLGTLTYEPPRRRFGRVFVGTPHASRGRSFRVVFVPGLAERVFPQRIREDALLLDDRRAQVSESLPQQSSRAADERLQLSLAAGAARERLYLSYPRVELNESRPRVPSFYVLDAVRAIEGAIPPAARIADRAYQEGGSRLAWPAPDDPTLAIDAFEHDLATIGRLLASRDTTEVKGRARYLYELSPELQRSLTSRWMRWHRRQWGAADGLVRSVPETTAPGLARQRLGARPYSLTALQRFSACPYQFVLASVFRLAPLDDPAPLQKLDPLTRGDLFHRIQAHVLRRLQSDGLLPLSAERLPRAQKLLEWSVAEIGRDAYDELAPAIDRVWYDEVAAMSRDLKIWLEMLAAEGAEWTPERFELSFGLEASDTRDPHSSPQPASVDGRFLLRGSIDMVERHRQTGLLRVTDHKTGRNRTQVGRTIVAGGRVLQPVLYGLALEALAPDERVYAGRLSFCTAAGGFSEHEIPLLDSARSTALEVLTIVDRSIEHGLLAARPDREACKYCDFLAVCGREEERRTGRKDPATFADLDALRNLP